ncbi:MAG: DUF3598 family protein [Synechococcales cyanobacterium RU_4_20]|nr:DUF3598 family protein [Synechococcales cyanobacterium RU_4_20]
MKSQWDCIRANLGEWHGSFTRFSLDGEVQTDNTQRPNASGASGWQHSARAGSYAPRGLAR